MYNKSVSSRESVSYSNGLERKLYLLVLSIFTYLSITGCTLLESEPESAMEIDGEFHVIGEIQLHTEMRKMSKELNKLVNIYMDSRLQEPDRKNEALSSLDRIQSIADELGGSKTITNFSVINDYMGAFLYDVNVAKAFINRNPPNYYPAGSLIKSCLSCHRSL